MPEITVKVIDAEINKPLFGVVVAVDSKVTATNHEGIARIIVPPGTYILKIRSPFHEPVTQKIEVTKDMTIEAKIRPVHL